MKHFGIFLIWFITCGSIFGVSSQGDGLDNFLTLAMEDFPSWLEKTNAYPTPIPTEISLRRTQGFIEVTSGKVWDQIVSNYTGKSTTVLAYLLNGYLQVTTEFEYVLSGNYEVEGSVFSTSPIKGEGPLNITFDEYFNAIITRITVNGFGITPEGYIDLSVGTTHYEVGVNFAELTFEGLSAEGYEEEVSNLLKQTYQEKLRERNGEVFRPLVLHLRRYLEELFAETPVSEIIGVTLPPTTTTQSSTSTSPCIGASGKVLSEEVLEKNVTTGANGETIMITKRMLVIQEII